MEQNTPQPNGPFTTNTNPVVFISSQPTQPPQTVLIGSAPRSWDHRDTRQEKHQLFIAACALAIAVFPFLGDISTGCKYVDFALSIALAGAAGFAKRYLQNNTERIEVGPCVGPCDPPHQGPPTVPFQGRW